MNNPSKDTWRAVVALLVTDSGAPLHYQAMQATARLAKAHPVVLAGEAAPLNHLIALETRDPKAHASLMALIERKRAELGLAPLEAPEPEGFDKVEYMRHFMAQKRQRLVRAADDENAIRKRAGHQTLRGPARLEFMRIQGVKWNDELERRIDRAREAAGGRVPQKSLDVLRVQFWKWVDDQLDAAEKAARGPQ